MFDVTNVSAAWKKVFGIGQQLLMDAGGQLWSPNVEWYVVCPLGSPS